MTSPPASLSALEPASLSAMELSSLSVSELASLPATELASLPATASSLRIIRQAALLCCLLFGPLSSLPDTATAQVSVRVETLAEDVSEGRLESLSKSGVGLRSEDGAIHSIDHADVLCITATDFDDIPAPRMSATPWIFLASGDRLRLEPVSITQEKIIGRWSEFPALENLSIPLESCLGIAIGLPSETFSRARAISGLLEHEAPADLLTLRNGDSVSGEFLGLENRAFAIETPLGKIRTELARTRSMAFNPELVSIPEEPSEYALVVLRDGSALRLQQAKLDGDLLVAQSIFGPEIQLPVLTLRSLRFFDSNRVDLTRRKPDHVDVVPFLSVERSPVINRNVLGGLIRQQGQLIPTGIGVTSATRMKWDLAGEFQAFRAEVGVDDVADGGGHVVAEVLVDGKPVWKSKPLTGATGPAKTPSIDVSNAAELTLRIDPAHRGNVRDYVDWFHAVLLRRERE